MMFSFRRRTASKPASDKRSLPLADNKQPDNTELHLRHLDYDGQPLSVESLSHYMAPIVEEERFRVH